MMNKRGVTGGEETAKLIIAVISIVVIVTILGLLIYNYLTEGRIAACKNWLILNYVKKDATLGFTGVEPFFGYQSDEDHGNLYTDNSPCITSIEKITKKDVKKKENLHKKLADNLYYCWRQYGEGQIDFYSDIDFGAGDTYCRVCSDIVIDKGIKDQKINLDEFEEFLSNEISPNKEDTYAEFFVNEKNAKLDFGEVDLVLNENSHLYSIFAIKKKGGDISLKSGVVAGGSCIAGSKIGGPVGGIIGGIAGAVGGAGVGAIPGTVVGAKAGALAGCGIGIVWTSLTYSSDKVPTLMLYQNDPKKLKDSCDSVIINIEKESKAFEKIKLTKET